MLTWDERLMIGLKMLEKLRPSLRARQMPLSIRPLPSEAFADEALMPGMEDAPAPEGTAGRGADQFEAAVGLPSLEALLEQAEHLAAYSVVLGVCEDGLPFLLDLTNPAPGALLIAGEAGSGKTRLLRAVLASAAYLNSPDEVAFYLVAHHADEYADLAETDHCQQLSAVNEKGVGELIEEMALLVEERRRGNTDGPAVMLVIDDLVSCVQFLDEQAFARLYWLIRHGPRSRLWTFATLPAERAAQIDPRFLAAFRTRLVGHIADRHAGNALSGDATLNTRALESGYEFCVPYGDEWVHFWICDPEMTGNSSTTSSVTVDEPDDVALAETTEYAI